MIRRKESRIYEWEKNGKGFKSLKCIGSQFRLLHIRKGLGYKQGRTLNQGETEW